MHAEYAKVKLLPLEEQDKMFSKVHKYSRALHQVDVDTTNNLGTLCKEADKEFLAMVR